MNVCPDTAIERVNQWSEGQGCSKNNLGAVLPSAPRSNQRTIMLNPALPESLCGTLRMA
jgi:hypothetical protein